MAFKTYVLVFTLLRLLTTKSFLLQSRTVSKCMNLKMSVISKSNYGDARNPFARQQTVPVPHKLSDFNDWNKIIDEKLFYVDKTDAITVIENTGNFLKLTAPEGTGKSLFCQQLACYYGKHTSSNQVGITFVCTLLMHYELLTSCCFYSFTSTLKISCL